MSKLSTRKKPPKKSHLLAAGVGISILGGGYLGLILRNALNFLSLKNAQVSYDPFSAIKTALTTPQGWIGIAIVGIMLGAMAAYYSKKGIFDFEANDDRNFRVSDQGTYGTANFATYDDVEEKFDILPCEKTSGAILGMLDEKGRETVSRRDYTQPKGKHFKYNPNIAVFGAAGTGKSFSIIRPAIIQAAKNQESMIITDTKGEMYRDCSAFLRMRGYTVRVFNLVDIACSDAWNCFADMLADDDPVRMAQTLSETIIRNTSGTDRSDRFWDEAEKNLLTALTLLVLHDSFGEYGEHRGLATVYDLITTTDLKELHGKMSDLPTGHDALPSYSLFKKSSDNIQASVLLGLGGRLQVFQNENVKKITSYNEIDLTLPGKEKCAYFLILSDQESTFTFLSSLFFSFIFIRLVKYADSTSTGSLPVRVNLLLDEFCNIGVIQDMNRKISTVRSRNIAMTLIMQNLPQLRSRYPKESWEEILGNCDLQICLGCSDDTTANYVSGKSGIMTIDVSTIRTSMKTVPIAELHPEYTRSSGVGKRPVLNPDEVLHMDSSEMLLMAREINIVRMNKFDYRLLPESKEFRLVDVRKHVPRWRKAELEKEGKRPKPVAEGRAAAEAAGTVFTQTRPPKPPSEEPRRGGKSGGAKPGTGESSGSSPRQPRPERKGPPQPTTKIPGKPVAGPPESIKPEVPVTPAAPIRSPESAPVPPVVTPPSAPQSKQQPATPIEAPVSAKEREQHLHETEAYLREQEHQAFLAEMQADDSFGDVVNVTDAMPDLFAHSTKHGVDAGGGWSYHGTTETLPKGRPNNKDKEQR